MSPCLPQRVRIPVYQPPVVFVPELLAVLFPYGFHYFHIILH